MTRAISYADHGLLTEGQLASYCAVRGEHEDGTFEALSGAGGRNTQRACLNDSPNCCAMNLIDYHVISNRLFVAAIYCERTRIRAGLGGSVGGSGHGQGCVRGGYSRGQKCLGSTLMWIGAVTPHHAPLTSLYTSTVDTHCTKAHSLTFKSALTFIHSRNVRLEVKGLAIQAIRLRAFHLFKFTQ